MWVPESLRCLQEPHLPSNTCPPGTSQPGGIAQAPNYWNFLLMAPCHMGSYVGSLSLEPHPVSKCGWTETAQGGSKGQA